MKSKHRPYLFTDGAPQQAGVDGPTLDAKVKAAADTLKNQGIKLVTVGLSMGDVKRGSRLLYDIASNGIRVRESWWTESR